MQGKPYPEAKRRILVNLSIANFITFLEEVTDSQGKLFISHQLLPKNVKGFRKGRAPFKQTVPKLIAKLKKEQELTNRDSPIWDSFEKVWMFWIKSYPELDKTLRVFDNKKDFDDDYNCIIPPNSDLDIECFKFLLKASHNAPIHQEMVTCFYEYGYFNEDERIQNLINQIPSREEIQRREQLAELPCKVDELSQTIDVFFQNIENLKSRISAMESANELGTKLTEQIAIVRQYFDTELQQLEQTMINKHSQFDNRISSIESNSKQSVGLIRRGISSLKAELFDLSQSVNSLANELTEIKSVNREEIDRLINQQVQGRIKQLNSQMPRGIESFEMRLAAAENAISEIKSEMTDGPKMSIQALKIGKRHKTTLKKKAERYCDENEYLDDFCHCLQRFGIIDYADKEIAPAIHIALKTFPAIEIIDDARIIKVWRLMCDHHFQLTTINVEMGWLGLQDWFPTLFAQQCFGERLEPVELEASIKKMIELGDMPWVIYFRYCDRSFPDIYLSGFLDWIGGSCHKGIKTFLIRCSGTNRCKTNENFYERIARLPKPKDHAPIESMNLKPSRIPLTLSKWHSWCQSNPNIAPQYREPDDLLEKMRSVVGKRGWEIPRVLLRETQHYLRLSHNIMAPKRALDWALTLRFLPWIGNRHRLIETVQDLLNNGNQELPHFQEGLQIAREAGE